MTAYLNTVYFGDGAYGAEVAARKYFGKSAEDLTLGEAATLAGFLHAPSTYLSEDRRNTRRATERRDEVLDLMHEQGMISNAERLRAEARPVRFAPRRDFHEKAAYQPFLDEVGREAEEEFGEGAIERGGLRIYTTFNPRMQHVAIKASKESLYNPDDPSAAVVTIAPQSGAIRVLAGRDGEFNLPLDARRQPGSVFKPFVLAAALKQGISPETNYISHNLEVEVEGHKYPVSNYGMIERGQITVAKAMAESDNTVFVQLAADVGYQNVADTAHSLGITTPIEPYPSTAIGGLGVGVSPLDMASAYATFAAGGVYREPYTIERASRVSFGKRKEVYDHRQEGRRVMSTNEAAMLTQVLRGVVEEGTASRFRDLDSELGRPSAGKTGTTDEFADAWYVGYTPRLSTAVWVGYPESRRSMVGVHGLNEVNGETLPLDIFADYMAQATAGQPVLGFPEPDESQFKITSKGYAVKPIAPAPRSGDTPLLTVTDNLDNLGERIRGMVDEALRNAFSSR
jgi:penicillin-binding protein 1A